MSRVTQAGLMESIKNLDNHVSYPGNHASYLDYKTSWMVQEFVEAMLRDQQRMLMC